MSLYSWVQEQIKKAYTYLKEKYPTSLMEQLLEPMNIVEADLTITMDDGSSKTYKAWRSQHTNIKGPFKWGIRFHQNVSLDEVKSLSVWMSFKTATVNLPLWWGKGWIIVNPKELSSSERERLSRAYIDAIWEHIWPKKDVPAPDVNTNGQIMAWMADQYAKNVGERQPWVITGKPLSIWWSKWRSIATALGWLYVLQKYLDHNNTPLAGKKIIVQGAGNAGLTFADLVSKEWWIIVGISDSKWWIYNANWLDIDTIKEIKAQKWSVTTYSDGDILPNLDILDNACDILVPAALENQITKENAWAIQAPLILELANGPTTPEAQDILKNNNIKVLPDILANAWGVTVSYFEQVQNNMNYYRSEEDVFVKLQTIMHTATNGIIETANTHNVSLRDAAYIVALDRLLEAMYIRWW